MSIGEAFETVLKYLQNSDADENVMNAFDFLRNDYTQLIGRIIGLRDMMEDSVKNG